MPFSEYLGASCVPVISVCCLQTEYTGSTEIKDAVSLETVKMQIFSGWRSNQHRNRRVRVSQLFYIPELGM